MRPTIRIDPAQIKQLQDALENTKKKLPRELSIAINRTSKFMLRQTAKQVVRGIRLKQKEVRSRLKVTQRAKPQLLSGVVTLKGTARLSLRRFSYKQTRVGVPFKIEKTGQRQIAQHAFVGPKPGKESQKLKNGVWRRKGKKRKPLAFLRAVSVVPYYLNHHLDRKTHPIAQKRLKYEIDRRIGQALRGF